MVVFDKGYTEIRNKYIRPLSNHYVQYRQLKNNNIKSVLLDKTLNIVKSGTKEYCFYLKEEILLKALLGDVFLFYIRSVLQKNDYGAIEGINIISPNWNIVTHYYKSFFDASLLLRLCFRGNIFLDKEYKKKLEMMIDAHINEKVELDSNLFYYIEDRDGNLVLKLVKSDNNTHETVWQKVNELLEEIELLSNPKSEEKALLCSCLDINKKLSTTFPSQLRNKVNYQPLYGLEAVDKNLYSIIQNEKWTKELMSFEVKGIKGNDNRMLNVYVSYASYIEKLGYRLLQDYFEMAGREDHILAQINTNRLEKITISDIPFSYG